MCLLEHRVNGEKELCEYPRVEVDDSPQRDLLRFLDVQESRNGHGIPCWERKKYI